MPRALETAPATGFTATARALTLRLWVGVVRSSAVMGRPPHSGARRNPPQPPLATPLAARRGSAMRSLSLAISQYRPPPDPAGGCPRVRAPAGRRAIELARLFVWPGTAIQRARARERPHGDAPEPATARRRVRGPDSYPIGRASERLREAVSPRSMVDPIAWFVADLAPEPAGADAFVEGAEGRHSPARPRPR